MVAHQVGARARYQGGEASLHPMFACYAENVFHVGPAGHAIRIKLVHNYIAFTNVASWCEGFALAARDGLDLDKVIGIISAAGGRSGMLDLYGQATLERDFTPHMSLVNARVVLTSRFDDGACLGHTFDPMGA